MPFKRLAAVAGFLFVALAVALVLTGVPPDPDASGDDILRSISTDKGMHKAHVIVAVLGSLPLAVFVAGLLIPFRVSDRLHDEGWATSMLIGAIFLMSSIAIGDSVLYGLFLRGGEGLDPADARAFWDVQYVAYAGAGLAVAVMMGSAAVPVIRHGVFPRWHGLLSILLAILGGLAAIDMVTTATGGAFHSSATLGFAIVWVLATSILLYRMPAGGKVAQEKPASAEAR